MQRSMPHSRLRGCWKAAPVIAVAGLLTAAGTANATIYTPLTGPQLQADIQAANASVGVRDTIRLPSGVRLSPTNGMTITDNLTITASHSSDSFAQEALVDGGSILPTTQNSITIAAGVNVEMSAWTFVSGSDDGSAIIRNNGTLVMDGMNIQTSAGSGVFTGGSGNTLIRNSTIGDNAQSGIAGNGTTTLINVTVADNLGNGLAATGLTMRNTVVNQAFTGGIDCIVLPVVSSSSLDGDGTCGATPTGDPLFSSGAANNGGPTDTRAPDPGSPIIDAGDPAFCSAADQRFYPRLGTGPCDIGSHETGAVRDTVAPTCVVTAVRAGPPKQQDVTLRDAGAGIGSDAVAPEEITIANGTVAFTPFTTTFRSPGTAPAPSNDGLLLTATKTDQSAVTQWSFLARDWAGNVRNCA